MNRLIVFTIAIIIALSSAQAAHNSSRDQHFWVLRGDSAFEIYTYDLARCGAHPATYCTYWTTSAFTFHTMSDTLFNALLTAGYFTGHDYDRRYLN